VIARPFSGRRVVLVEGVRTPFLRSQTAFTDLMAYELGAMAVSGLLARSRLDAAEVDLLIMGTVLAEPRTSNIAREIGLASGIPNTCPAYTVTSACISANVAIEQAARAIATGAANVAIAGGAETLSDVPIRFSRPLRRRLIASQKARGPVDYFRLLSGLAPRDLRPEIPAIAEFSTGLTMGDNGERLAKRLGLTRQAQDAFALASHQRAARATAEGLYASQIVPAFVPPDFAPIAADNGIRADSSLEKLSKIPPAFDRTFGTVTAGNSSFLTDGAAACLLMSEEKAQELGMTPLAAIAGSSFVAIDPVDELLLGPVFSIPKALAAAGISFDDVGVWEIHEAFAAPVLAAIQLLADADFCRQRLGLSGALGTIPGERLNSWGGSLSLGHPFGATGARLVTTCAQRLEHEGARYGVVTACAAGALGHALVLERVA
jgi:acetyl-CoA acetyltransferase family protein